jgi:L-threonylcarbamoyladenylate synthase
MFENEKIEEILTALKNSGVILLPTDTIWGLSADITDDSAIEKIISIKKRVPEKGFICLVDSLEMLKTYVGKLHPRIETLLHYHHRPLTVIYDAPILPVSKHICANDGSIAIRIVQDPFCANLIKLFGKPIVSTSANVSGSPFPTGFGSISSEILQQVDFVVRYKQHTKETVMPSTIVRLSNDEELDFIRE